MSKQMTLIPETPPRLEMGEVPLSQVNVGEHPPIEADFIESVRRFGLMQPPVLRRIAEEWYAVVEGRRRIAALRMIGESEYIDAVIVTGDVSDEAVALMLNAQRSDNPVSDLAAIERLITQGAGERDIYDATGLAIPTIRKRMRLKALVPGLRAAFDTGNLAVSVAEACAKEPPSVQERLVAILSERGKLLLKDVREARKVRQADTVAALPQELFAEPLAEETKPQVVEFAPGIDDWFYWAAHTLGQVVDSAPSDASKVALDSISFARDIFKDISDSQADGFLAADERVDISDVVNTSPEPYDEEYDQEPDVDDDFPISLEYNDDDPRDNEVFAAESVMERDALDNVPF